MVTIKLHNTKSRTKQVFTPIDATNVRIYVCGPTVYDRAHLGNARPVVVFDVLYRLLRHVYGADHVTYVRNFTDVDDKINATAQSRKAAGDPRSLEALIRERTEETIGWYHADMDALGALRPSMLGVEGPKAEPRATDYIEAMKDMIRILIEKKNAYVVRDKSNNPPADYVLFNSESHEQGHALFSVDSYEGYGALSGRSVEDMIVGARAEFAPDKRNPADFVLWKPSDSDLPGWDSPWGRGRPGWHIECSAMADELLMKDLPENEKSFDIHGGGLDLLFPHHENEIAQSMCAHPKGEFARFWMHNEMLQVEGKKMSKSLSNFFTVRELLEQGISGIVIRYVILGTHYSKPMDWTKEKAEQARRELFEYLNLVKGVEPSVPDVRILDALADDLNTPLAIFHLRNLRNEVVQGRSDPAIFRASLDMIGVPHVYPTVGTLAWGEYPEELHNLANQLARRWFQLRINKNYSEADVIRTKATALGIKLEALNSENGQQASARIEREFDEDAVKELLK